MLITPANARRIADRLSELRGAAMKVGQLLSMESGELIPPVLSEVLARRREGAHTMPLGQVAQVLDEAWGSGWDSRFQRFFFTPLAAASIGQVHEALLKDGRRLAIKIQYPGIRRSIDSDVDNVGKLLRLFVVVPKETGFGPLLEEAKRSLHQEANYPKEALFLQRFFRRLDTDNRFELPEVVESLTTPEVLAMTFLDGEPIERLADIEEPVRNQTAGSLLELTFREAFEWGLVQTDPNFANYRYQPATGRLQLFDFGATREYDARKRETYRALILACVNGDDADVGRAAIDVGYVGEDDPKAYQASIIELLRAATEPVWAGDQYDFGVSDLARRMSAVAVDLRMREKSGRLPPPDLLFLHRKLGGLYLLFSRLRVTLPARALISPFLDQAQAMVGAPVSGEAVRA